MIDLHVHSTASDGELEPAALVRHAHGRGVTAFALTDHDTTAGFAEARAEGDRLGVEVIPGVEISLERDPGTFHLIGLFIDPEDGPLSAALARVREGRKERNGKIAARLAELGMPVRLPEVAAEAGGEVVARPHFAKVLVRRGYVGSITEAFNRFLGKGAPAYVDRFRMTPATAIPLIHGAGGVAVLCHPHTLGFEDEKEGLLPFLEELASLGLDAMEVLYGDYAAHKVRRYRRMAKRAGLLESGGSDFHGFATRGAKLGIGAEKRPLPEEALTALRLRAATRAV